MGLLSKIMKPIVRGRAPISRRNMGGLEPRTPMPPRRGGLPRLIERVKDKRLQRPISIGGVGGGISAIKEPSPLAPPRQRPINRPPLRREDVVSIRPREELIDMGVVAPPPVQQPIPVRPPQLPPKRGPIMSIGGPGGGITDDRAISPIERPNFIGRSREQIDEMIAKAREQAEGTVQPPAAPIMPLPKERLDPPRILPPLPPMDIGRPPIPTDSIGMPLVDPNMPIGDGSRRRPQPGEPGATPIVPPVRTPLSERTDVYGAGKRFDPANLPEGFSFDSPPDRMYTMDMPPPGFVYAYGPDGERRAVPSGEPGAAELRDRGPRSIFDPNIRPPVNEIPTIDPALPPQLSDQAIQLEGNIGNNPPPTPDPALDLVTTPDPVTPTVDPVTTAPTPSATTEQGTDPIQSMPTPVGALDPVLLGQKTTENLSDPLTRALYFGTQDQPGFYQQLQQAGANLIGQDVPLQQTAGLTPLELLARQQAVAGLGGFEPFFQQNKDLIDQAIGQSRRAEALRDPYFSRAERQMQIGLGDELSGIGQARGITVGATDRFGGSLGRLGRQAIGSTVDYGGRLGESEDLIRGTLGGYDQGMTQQFYNPFEDRVVQQTIDDVLEAGDKQDIAARAREISSGAFGGSRARLGAMERREALGEGLAKALGSIRQQGFSEAQRTGLSEFARQKEAERAASRGLSGLAGSRLGAQQQLGSTLRGLTGDQLAAQQQLAANLMGYGAAGAGARQNLATGLLGIGQQRGAGASALGQQLAGYGSQIGDVGSVLDTLRRGQRSELTGYGATGRGIAETGLSRIFQQQLAQQQRPLGVLGQIGSMLPGYQQTSTRIDSQYGLPTDPSAAGLGAAFSAYGSLAPRQGQS